MNSEFVKYQHLERFGTTEVEGIQYGECYIFPKLDGTNASAWFDGKSIKAGSRNRELSLEKDNAGFYEWLLNQNNIISLFEKYPNIRLYGEFLVPHSLKTYRDDAWKKLYVFDVIVEENGERKYLHYNQYKQILEEYSIDYIPAFYKIKNPEYNKLLDILDHNNYLIKDGHGKGEGIVIKNYDYVNKFGRTIWAKMVTSEFKEKNIKTFGATELQQSKLIEEEIVDKFITKALCEKEYSKIENEDGWSNKMIPKLLNVIYYNLIKEECWNFVKDFKNPTVNFKTLQHFSFSKTKEHLKNIF
ncbi:RNA ligase family protein [Elizabethkingia meningoseptica]|uniref:RNA ligase family protein n=1 Tax=Elizabethkingia meningoseptica TaxID=238 RepID=UPI00162A6FDD|nr:RNA ligase family protein [Elizabethkingia meningoseptica]HAY3553760.1 hypothetical protein [Elizabethkingia meningoseptica]